MTADGCESEQLPRSVNVNGLKDLSERLRFTFHTL